MSGAALGLVLARPARLLGEEAFFSELVAGMEEALSPHGLSVLLHMVPDHEAEQATWRRWDADRLLDALVVVDLLVDDSRLRTLADLRLPAVVLGGPPDGLPVSSVYVDDDAAARAVVEGLADLGHRHLGRVSGPRRLWHTARRDEAFADECARRGMTIRTLEGDYTEEAGARLTRDLLGTGLPLTALVFDNDAMAAAGLAQAAAAGLRVPQELSVVAWDDSTLCRLTSPALSVIAVDVHAMGEQLAGVVLDAVAGGPRRCHRAAPHRLLLRRSTAPAPAGPSSAARSSSAARVPGTRRP
ncbi:LacI family DNA-binding transcriptional regulator [Kineosporia sp. R_H_3]|uniref:LacI family DNA-binding transcriptional regulator n=1 Tax=Kineosporia sp. R_H_3 TaxID=1961848 RepID=UPI000B4BB5F6|nr:substrate-binding domain-containing protein [Kineosporia sp. R_H_3]